MTTYLIKTTLLLIALLVYNLSFSQITIIPDTNFEQKLIADGIDTNGLTGDILNSDAASITFLNVSYSSISDITGIEAFVNLETLIAVYNEITTVDLSSNVALSTINFTQNNITSLDVTNNVFLQSLSIEDNNINTTIDLSQNTELTSLRAKSNANLTSLSLTNNTKLINLLAQYTSINDLDLSTNTLLEVIALSEVPLASLDLTNQPNLVQLFLVDYPLTDIDISQNINLVWLELTGGALTSLNTSTNTALEYLNTSENPIESFDLSQNINLTYFDSWFSNMTELDLTQNINLATILVNNCTNLTTINVKNGANSSITDFIVIENPNLTCIIVDDINGAYLDSWLVDNASAYKEDNAACSAILGTIDFNFLDEVSLYPNPSKDFIKISGLTKAENYKLYNVLGSELSKGLISDNEKINIQNLDNGLYFLKFENGSTLKFIKK